MIRIESPQSLIDFFLDGLLAHILGDKAQFLFALAPTAFGGIEHFSCTGFSVFPRSSSE
jgi:predicted metalloprotease with PDZ domain